MAECDCQDFPDGERRIWCQRHQVWKTRHWFQLCKTRADYRKAWDDGRGPGQVNVATPRNAAIKRTPRTKNVGDYMKDLTGELGIQPKHGCGCDSLANEMNRLGPDGCRRDRARLVGKLQTNAKRYSWGDVARAAMSAVKTGLVWQIDLMDPYGSLLDEAIRRAERKDGETNDANSS